MLDIDDFVDLTNWQFYIPIISAILVGCIGIIIYSKILQNNTNQGMNIIYFAILILLFFADLAAYIISIRICSHRFISYFFSIYLPLPLLFITIFFVIYSGIKSIKKFKWTIQAINDFSSQLFIIVSIKCCFLLAYGSISAIIWIFTDYLVTLAKVMYIAQKFELSYDKKID